MNKIILDLEFTKLSNKCKAQRAICKCETIQFGAVKLGDSNEILGTFNSYVKPIYSKVSPEVTRLTHITDEMVQTAPSFETVLSEFLAWIGDDNTVVYSWSETDKAQLVAESTLKNCKSARLQNLFDSWIDLQALVGSLLGVHQQLSLENALNGIGISFEGQEHSAIDDAQNTAELFRLTENHEQFRKQAGVIMDMMQETASLTYSMGDLFKGLKIA